MSGEDTFDRPLIPGTRRTPSPGQIMRALIARWRIVAATLVVFVVFAALAAVFVTDSYTARTSLVIEFPSTDPVTGEVRSSNLAESYLATQGDILTSARVLEGVVRELNLTDDAAARARYQAATDGRTDFVSWLASQLAKHLGVSAGQSSRMVIVSYTSDDPVMAARIANAVVDQYRQASGSLASEPAKSRRTHFSDFLDDLRSQVDEAQTALADARERLNLIAENGTESVDAQRLANVGTKLDNARTEQQASAAALDQVQQARRSGGSLSAQADILDSASIQKLKDRLVGLQAQRSELAADLGPNHPRIRALDDQIATVRSKLAGEIDTYLASTKNAAETAADRVKRLQATYDAMRQQVMDEQHRRAELAGYQRRLDSAQQVYKAALNNYDQVLGGSELQQQNISVISRANPPTHPTGLSTRNRLAAALFAGLVVGVLLALLRELTDRRVRDAEDITRELDLPVLGELVRGGRT